MAQNTAAVRSRPRVSPGSAEARLAQRRAGRPGAGEGETELNRLFYRLGWTKGWYKGADREKRYGELRAFDGRAADLKAIKAKLLDMARKYDRQP